MVMANSSYLPSREEALLAWAQNASTLITATPTAFGLTAADATALASLVSAYAVALAAATNPSTSTPATVATKNTARITMVSAIRSMVKRVQATATVTPTQKISLGINVKDVHPTPIPAPSTRPVMSVVSVVGRTVSVRVTDETTPTKRAKPEGTAGLQVFSCITTGDAPAPDDLDQWTFEGLSGKSSFDIVYPMSAAPGTKVWACCRWYSPRREVGPVSDVVGTNLGGGVSAEAA
jgi:hypothetical protein